MPRGEKGHILVHVLITAVIIVVIMAAMARMILARYQAYGRHQQSDQGARFTASGINRLMTIWSNPTGQGPITCYDPSGDTNFSGSGYTCTRAGANPTTPPGVTDCKCCPSDTTNDAALTFIGAAGKMCIETPNGAGGYTGDTTDTTGGACPNITCP